MLFIPEKQEEYECIITNIFTLMGGKMNDMQNWFFIISTVITLLGSLSAIVISIRKVPLSEKKEEENIDRIEEQVKKLQAETTVTLLSAQQSVIEPLKLRIEQVEKERKYYTDECQELHKQIGIIKDSSIKLEMELDQKIQGLEKRIRESEEYVERLIYFIKGYGLVPPPRNTEEIKEKKE